MYRLNQNEYDNNVKNLIERIFDISYGSSDTFSALVSERILLYPYHLQLDEKLLNAIISSALNRQESYCYLVSLDYYPNEERPSCFHILLEELNSAYFSEVTEDSLPDFSQHIILSSQGDWGVMILFERMSFLGGDAEFINSIRKMVPEIDSQVYVFLADMLMTDFYSHSWAWAIGLVNHVYGTQKGTTMAKVIQEIIEDAETKGTLEAIVRIVEIRFNCDLRVFRQDLSCIVYSSNDTIDGKPKLPELIRRSVEAKSFSEVLDGIPIV